MKSKSLLFITWDSGTSNYLESLFFPILSGLQLRGYSMHVLQFSWAEPQEVNRLASIATQAGIAYKHVPIYRKPHAGLGTLWAVYRGLAVIKTYIQNHHIQVLMPRSIMPAMMINRLQHWIRNKQLAVVYDADGLSIEERVDFAGLKEDSYRYRKQKQEEKAILRFAAKVLTRSQLAVTYLKHQHSIGSEKPFFVVANGRDSELFKRDEQQRSHWRQVWGLASNDLLIAYTGSLGAPYAWERMQDIFSTILDSHPRAQFLVLTREKPQSLAIHKHLEERIRVINGEFKDIPGYLSAADVGISLRKPAPSLLGLAPIKIGEYLMMGLPLILSPGIGDSEVILDKHPFVWMDSPANSQALSTWINKVQAFDYQQIRAVGLTHYSLEHSINSYVSALEG